ncbi:MAG: hypothetical protein D6806_12515, partial [Deltaproteobacteria bacterium]
TCPWRRPEEGSEPALLGRNDFYLPMTTGRRWLPIALGLILLAILAASVVVLLAGGNEPETNGSRTAPE